MLGKGTLSPIVLPPAYMLLALVEAAVLAYMSIGGFMLIGYGLLLTLFERLLLRANPRIFQ